MRSDNKIRWGGPQERVLPDHSPADDPARAEASRLLHDLGHAVIVTDLSGAIRVWNPAAERLYGWTDVEVLGRNIDEVTARQIGDELRVEITRTLASGHEWSGSVVAQRKDGSALPTLVTATGLHDDGGRLVGVVGVSLDLGQALRPLLARLSEAAVALTPEATVSYVSPAAARVFGWTEQEVLGAALWDLVHPQDRQVAVDYCRQALADPGQVPPVEWRLHAADGAWRSVEVVASNLLDDPAVYGIVCSLRDVTQRREEADRLVALTEQLTRALSSRVVIEQAKGVVAASRGVGVDEAFQILRKHCRDHNANINAVANAVVSLGLRP